jgi:hypothetical protein
MSEGTFNIFNIGTSKKIEICINTKVIKVIFNTDFIPELDLLLSLLAKGSSWRVTFRGA